MLYTNPASELSHTFQLCHDCQPVESLAGHCCPAPRVLLLLITAFYTLLMLLSLASVPRHQARQHPHESTAALATLIALLLNHSHATVIALCCCPWQVHRDIKPSNNLLTALLPLDTCCPAARACSRHCPALCCCHWQVHRDIKPANILMKHCCSCDAHCSAQACSRHCLVLCCCPWQVHRDIKPANILMKALLLLGRQLLCCSSMLTPLPCAVLLFVGRCTATSSPPTFS
jgi:hypothetical protein